MNPHARGEERVRAGDGDGDRARQFILELHRLHEFLTERLVDEVVARLDQLGGCESPLVAAADHERVLWRRLQSAIDDHEAVVFAEADAGNAGRNGPRAVQAVVREPVVLGAVRHIDLEARHLDRRHAVPGLEVLDRGEAAILEAHERAKQEAVAARAAASGA